MKTNIALFFLFVCFIFFASVGYGVDYTTIQLTNNSYDDFYPQIDNGQVVWHGYGPNGSDGEIFLYNGNSTAQLTNNNYSDYSSQIDNGQVVWQGHGPNGTDSEIFLYNGTTTFQLTNNSYDDVNPQIDNGQVVWVWDGYAGGFDSEIFLYNGTTTFQLTNDIYSDFSPQIDNGQVVWCRYNNYNSANEIFLFNGTTTIQLTSGHSDYSPQIDNGQVVWSRYDGTDDEIFFFDGTTTVQLTNNSYRDVPPQIDSGQIVWNGYVDNSDSEIFLYNGTTTIQLTNNNYNDFYPQIDNGQVVWHGYGPNGSDGEIFLYNGTSTIQLTNNNYNDFSPQIDNGQVVWFGYDGYDYEIFLAKPGTNISPNATITSITPNPTIQGQTVTFTGTGTDSDGTIVAYNWRSSIDGQLSTQTLFSKSNLSAGTHTIYFKVQDNSGAWSEEAIKTLIITTEASPDNTHGRQKQDNSVGEPINITTGNMYTSPQKDIFIPGIGLPFNFYRIYNSQKNYDGPMGYGWTHSYNITLTEYADGLVKIMDEDGTGLYFTPNGGGTFTPPKGEHSSLLKNPDGTFRWTRKYKLLYDFDISGRLVKITNRNGNHIDLAYDGITGLLSTITDTAGRQIGFGYQNNRIITITDPVKTVTYSYDGYGNLKTATYPVDDISQEQRTYNYTDSNDVHNLTEIIDETGTSTYFIYDSQDRAYENYTGIDYNKIHLDFYPSEQKTVETRYRDGIPYQYTYYYDADGMITSITDPKGYVTSYHYDGDLNRTEILLSDTANGYYLKTKMTFDTNGNMTSVLKGKVSSPTADPTGTPITFTYHPTFAFLTSVTDELGRKTNYGYDPNTGDLLETYKNTTQNPSLKYASTLYTYFPNGLVETVTDPNSNVTTSAYDVQGNLASVDPPLLPPTTYDLYDAVGNLKQITIPGENGGRVTTFTYDKRGRMLSKVYPPAKAGDASLSESFVYDGLGYLLSHTDTADNVITYEYNDLGLVKKQTKTLKLEGGGERQLITQYFYDSVGNLKKITDPTSHSRYYEYDELNRVSRMTDESGNITDLTYYPDGSIKTMTDPKVNPIEYYYDAKNRLERIAYPDDSSKVYTYYDNGLVHTITNSEGTITYTYDDYNRIASVDGVLDNDAVTYTYYAGNQIESVTSPAGTVNYDIDELNRMKTITGYDALPISYSYYVNSGNLNSITYPNNTLAVHNYDNLDRIIDLINKTTSENIISSYNYEYNDAGLRQKVTFKDSSFNSYGYDSIYRLTSENKTSPNPYSISYSLDDIGNRNQIDKGEGAITYTHNLINQTESLNNPSLPKGNKVRIQGDVSDENIDRVEVNGVIATINGTTFTADVPLNAGDNPVTAIAYDKAGNSTPISISLTLDTASTSRFAYDANGNMIQRTELGKTTLYGYDYDNRLISVKDANNNIIKYRYDPLGRRTAKEVNGNTTYFIYDGERIIQERNGANTINYLYGPGIDDVLVMYKGGASYYYHKDALSSITDITSSSGLTVESYSYDAFGNLLTPASSIGNRYYFTGRELDIETGLYYYRNRYYDPSLGRFITQDPQGIVDDINLYAYCFNNPVNFVDPWGLGKGGKGNAWDWLWSNILEPPYNTLTQPGYNYGTWVYGEKNLRNFYGASLDALWLATGVYGAVEAVSVSSASYWRYTGPSSQNSGWVVKGYQPPYGATEAMDKLSAPIEWNSVYKMDVPFGQYVGGPRPAAPQFGRTGFGAEYKIGGFGDWGNYFKAWGKYIVDMVTGK